MVQLDSNTPRFQRAGDRYHGRWLWSPLEISFGVHLSGYKANGDICADKPQRYNPKHRQADRDTEIKGSGLLLHHPTMGMIPTFELSGIRVTWISSSRLLSGLSGRASAAAWMGTVQNKRRLARKPLMKTHWFSVGDELFF
jgi:hypothetical protein